jgi:hypothetical protein
VTQLELSKARDALPIELLPESVEWLITLPKYQRVFGSHFPKEFRVLGYFAPLDPTSFAREVRWGAALLVAHSLQINEFARLRSAFEAAVLTGRVSDAGVLLGKIREISGASYWWIKHALAHEEASEGIEAQKALAAQIKGEFNPRALSRYIVHQISVLNEPTVSTQRFVTDVDSEIDNLGIGESWKAVAKYHTTGGWTQTLDEAHHVLRIAAAESIVDLYEAFLHVGRVIVAQGDVIEARDHRSYMAAFNEVRSHIQDTRIDSLAFLMTHGTSGDYLREPLESYRAVLNGEKIDFSAELHQRPTDIGVHVLAAISNLPLDEVHQPAKTILSHLREVLCKSAGRVEQSAGSLHRLALAYPSIGLLSGVHAIAQTELAAVPACNWNILNPVAEAERKQIVAQLRYALATRLSSHPLVTRSYPRELALLVEHNNTELTDILNNSTSLCPDSMKVEESNTLQFTSALRDGDYPRALELARQLYASNVPFYSRTGTRAVAHCLLMLGRYPECVQFATSEYMRDFDSAYILPIRDLCDSLDKAVRRMLGSDLSLPIIFDMYARYIDTAYDNVLRRTLGQVLRAAGVSRPTELRSLSDKFPTSKLVYFLYYVCVPEELYATGAYSGTPDLLGERIAVLQWLTELSPQNAGEFEEEIVDRTRRIVLESRRADVEQSKIQLNYEGFRREAEKSLRESYERYFAYRRAGISSIVPEMPTPQASASASAPLLARAMPSDESGALFHSIVTALADIFVGNRFYGLDGALSTRIRHGVVESELRSPLVAAGLVTSRDASGTYRFNDEWLGELFEENPEIGQRVETHLDRFARDYDSLLGEIKDDWIRVRRRGSDKGMIELIVNEAQSSHLQTAVDELDLPFSTFVAGVFQFFVSSLEPGLSAIRERLGDEGKRRALQLIDRLERNLESAGSTARVQPLFTAIKDVRGAILRAFDRVMSWFTLALESASEPLPFTDVVQVAVEMAQHFNPQFQATVHVEDAANITVAGMKVVAYTDVFMQLFNNILTHSELERPAVTLHCAAVDSRIRVNVKNELGASTNDSAIRSRIAGILSAIEDGSYRERVNDRGGTGIFRVYEIIRTGMSIDPELSVTLGAHRTFEVTLHFPTDT